MNKFKVVHREARKSVRKLQKRNCSTHNQKLARHSTTKVNPDATTVGLQNKKGNGDKIQRETQTWGSISNAEFLGAKRLFEE